jgi:dynamin family protein
MSALLEIVAAVADQAAARLPEGHVRQQVIALRRRLEEPLRVAVGGRVSAGKSTLANALIGQRVAVAGAGEVTRVLTWLRYGEVDDAVAVLHDGRQVPVALGPTRALPADLGVDPADVERLDVRLYNDALEDVTYIDTPGLQSVTEGVSERTDRLLGRGDAGGVAQADALVYVVADDLRADDEQVIGDFASHAALVGATGANAVLAVTKVDRIIHASGRDALDAMLDRWRARLGARVTAVIPVMGLIAETALSGRLDERRATAIAALAQVDPQVRDAWLRSPRRFLADGTVPAVAEDRADLLARLDVYGIREAAELAAVGVTGAAALTRQLADLSGITGVRSLIAEAFTARAALLKADAALHALRALTEQLGAPDEAAIVRDALIASADRLVAVPEAQRLRELALLRELAAGALTLPDPLEAEVHRLATGLTFRQRLDLPAGATPEDGTVAAAAAAARWRRFQFDGRRTPGQRRAAHVVGLSLTHIARELRTGAEVV